MIEKETIKGERMGEAGQKTGRWGQKVGGKHLWERAAPAGVLDQELQQGREAAPQNCWLFKKSCVLNLSLCCL